MTEGKKKQATADRRSFLKLAGLGAAAGGAAIVATAPSARAETNQDGGKHGEYRESEHVKRYYDLAREM